MKSSKIFVLIFNCLVFLSSYSSSHATNNSFYGLEDGTNQRFGRQVRLPRITDLSTPGLSTFTTHTPGSVVVTQGAENGISYRTEQGTSSNSSVTMKRITMPNGEVREFPVSTSTTFNKSSHVQVTGNNVDPGAVTNLFNQLNK